MPDPQLRAWREAVKARDRMCLRCRSTQHLRADHIVSRKECPALSFDVENGQTLCQSCHLKKHAIEQVAARAWERSVYQTAKTLCGTSARLFLSHVKAR